MQRIEVRRKPFIVGVMGGHEAPPEILEEARRIGEGIAKRGHVILTGGGDGVMKAASEGAFRAGGLVLAVLPSDRVRPLEGYPNDFVDIAICTGMATREMPSTLRHPTSSSRSTGAGAPSPKSPSPCETTPLLSA